jgi:hypothetical protein
MNTIKKRSKITFAEEKHPYVVRAIGKRYAVCTKPFNLKHTVLYTVIDIDEKIRGTEDLIFGMGAETEKDCNEMLYRLEHGESEVSYRNRVPLIIKKVTNGRGKGKVGE